MSFNHYCKSVLRLLHILHLFCYLKWSKNIQATNNQPFWSSSRYSATWQRQLGFWLMFIILPTPLPELEIPSNFNSSQVLKVYFNIAELLFEKSTFLAKAIFIKPCFESAL